jgi:hypothetical protein
MQPLGGFSALLLVNLEALNISQYPGNMWFNAIVRDIVTVAFWSVLTPA